MKRDSILYLAGAALLLLGGGTALYSMTRGLRNNNPGNIRLTSPPTSWEGWVGSANQTDTDFVQFATAAYGIRALAHILGNYYATGYQTVSDIISRWSATDQAAYIANVASALNVDPSATLDFSDPNTVPTLIAAIITQENGVNPYSADTIAQGIATA